jgi:hypothetical protein
MTLADKHRAKRQISLGCGYEERDEKEERERDRERSVCHGT